MVKKNDSDPSNPIGWRAIVSGLFVGLIVTVAGGLLLAWLTTVLFNPNDPSSFSSAVLSPVPTIFPQARPIGPKVFGNVRSAQSKYGCVILLGQTDDEQLSICNGSFNLPEEWVTKVQRFAPDCTTTSTGGAMLELWTGENLTGELWDYSTSC